MASDPHGWPDPARPGYPANPERSGWHWLKHPEDLRPFPSAWNAELAGWPSGALHSPQGLVDLGFAYLGPCLTPAEVAAAVQAERDEIARDFDDARVMVAGTEVARSIRARGPADALAEALAQARREGMEEAARIADERGNRAADLHAATPDGVKTAWRWDHVSDEARFIAGEIRSAAGEAGE